MTIPKVIFKFDKEEDLKNIWETANSEKTYGRNFKKNLTKNILEICENKSYEKCRTELKKTMNYIHDNPMTLFVVEVYNKSWKKIEKEYFNRLKKIMKVPLFSKKVIAYLTTAGRCPYNPDKNSPSFFVNFFNNIPDAMETTGHELMHIQFHNSKYWNICERELGNEKTHDLKEALSVLLDLEFRDLWIAEDGGYTSHAKLRAHIEEQWKKEKNFGKLIDNSIKWIKKNGVK